MGEDEECGEQPEPPRSRAQAIRTVFPHEVGWLAASFDVHPLRVHCGLRWETEELAVCSRFLDALATRCRTAVRPLEIVTVAVPAAARPAWSLGGSVPGAESPDTDVLLPGRNATLLDSAAKFCAPRGIARIALATLAGNPFPDATPRSLLSKNVSSPSAICMPSRSGRPSPSGASTR